MRYLNLITLVKPAMKLLDMFHTIRRKLNKIDLFYPNIFSYYISECNKIEFYLKEDNLILIQKILKTKIPSLFRI